MKKIFLIVFMFFFAVSIAQTQDEVNTIVSKLNARLIGEAQNEINEYSLWTQAEIKRLIEEGAPEFYEDSDGNLHKLMRVTYDGKPLYYTTNNSDAAISTRTNFLHQGGGLNLNIEGQNMIAATWDEGPARLNHQEFMKAGESRINTPDASASNPESFHSTHVAGTVMAQGLNADAKGMAPQANLSSYDWDNDTQEVLNEGIQNGMLVTNHSYGIPVSSNGNTNPAWLMGAYSSSSRQWDLIANAAKFTTITVSAGNDGNTSYSGGLANGYDKLIGNKTSKNLLIVANAQNAIINPNGSGELLGTLFINPGSSQGPTDDGRIKPDITGNGTGVFSTSNVSNSAYATTSGTSMSAPNVAGSVLLLQQLYNDLNNEFMLASTVKALICHTADDAGNPGPNPIFGWGLLNSKKAAETIIGDANDDPFYSIGEFVLNNNETHTYEVAVTGVQKLEATIVWNDPAANAINGTLNSPSPRIVNDLDLKLTKGNEDFFPWKLSLDNVAGSAQKGVNNVDNVEKVEIEGANGIYTIVVNHKGNLTNNEQEYSIVVTGGNVSLSNKSFESTEFSIWPNPAQNTLNVSFSNSISGEAKAEIFDITGRRVMNRKINAITKNEQFDISNLNIGAYIIKIQTPDGVLTKKFLKK